MDDGLFLKRHTDRQFARQTDGATRGRCRRLIAARNWPLIATREDERVKCGEKSEGMMVGMKQRERKKKDESRQGERREG